jgi:DNA-binding CsgD family transcriptional regulator/N-acetylneuraminic acid mutarotase
MQKDLPIQVTAELTEREQEILQLLATGTSNKEIARDLFISSNTVKVHLRNIFAKIGVTSRTEAAMYAVHTGLVRSPAASGQDDGIPARAGSILAESQTTAAEVPPRPLFGVRQASMAAIVVILVVLVGVGILLTRQQATTATRPSQIVPTPESRWHVLAPLPTARSGLAVTVYENQIYAIGGDTLEGVTGLVERYDPATNSWVELSQKPDPVTDVNAAVIGGKIYVPGGRLASGEVTNILEVYDPRQDRWERGAPLPTALSAYAEVAFEGKLYLFGGWDGKRFMASVYEYDPDQDTWGARSPMPTARGHAGAATAGGKIYVLGGYDGKDALAATEEYLPGRDTWSRRAPMAAGRYAMGVASIADIIYVVGGVGEPDSILPPLQYFYQQDQWQTFEWPFSKHWTYLGLVSLQTQLYALGGQSDGLPAAQNFSYQAIYTITITINP